METVLASKAVAFKKGPTDLPYQNHQESLLKMRILPLTTTTSTSTKSEFPQGRGDDKEESHRCLHLLLDPWNMQSSGLP